MNAGNNLSQNKPTVACAHSLYPIIYILFLLCAWQVTSHLTKQKKRWISLAPQLMSQVVNKFSATTCGTKLIRLFLFC